MISAADLPGTIPVFPLPGALLLPRARLPLHIFEPRYLAMLDDTMKTPHRLIGMVQPREVPGQETTRLQAIGCAGRLTQFSETEDGRYMITLSGISRFRVTQEVKGFTPYRRCEVSWEGFSRDLGATEHDPGFERDRFLDLLGRYFEANQLQTDWSTPEAGGGRAADQLALHALPLRAGGQAGAARGALARDPARDAGDADRVRPPRRRERRDAAVRDAAVNAVVEAFHDRHMLEALVCPQTKAPLSYDAERQELVSRAAHLAYPIRNGIPVMLVDEARRTDD